MVIGAGRSQVPLIEAARREGYRTVVCDMDPMAPGAHLANEFLPVSTRDGNGLLEATEGRRVDGIVANSEYAMCDVSRIAGRLGLVGNPEAAVAALSSKGGFRALQRREGLFAPAFVPDVSAEKVLAEGAALSWPIIVKPDASSGTRAVAILADPGDREALGRAIDAARAVSRNGMAIVEELVPMPDRCVVEGEVFLNHGELLWDGLFRTVRGRGLPTIPMTYVLPLEEEEGRILRLKDALARAFRAAGIVHGEYNVEAFFTAGGEPFLIELNPRQGGNDLPRYVRESCGVDLSRMLVTTAMGDDGYWETVRHGSRERRRIVHHMLYPQADGVFGGLRIDGSIAGRVLRMHVEPSVGDRVESARDGSYDIGYVDLAFDDAAEQMRVAMRIEELVRMDIG